MTRLVSTTDVSIDDHAAPSQAFSSKALVQAVRWRTGLSQEDFAGAFHFDRRHLADLEQGRARPDAALIAYLRVIDHAPDTVRDALERAGF